MLANILRFGTMIMIIGFGYIVTSVTGILGLLDMKSVAATAICLFVLAFIWRWLGFRYAPTTRPSRPQVIELETEETPIQIVRAARAATFVLFLLFVLAAGAFAIAVHYWLANGSRIPFLT